MQEFLNFLKTESIISSADVLVLSHKPLRYEIFLKEIRWLSFRCYKIHSVLNSKRCNLLEKSRICGTTGAIWKISLYFKMLNIAQKIIPEPKEAITKGSVLPNAHLNRLCGPPWNNVWLSKEKVTSQLGSTSFRDVGLGCLWLLFETMIEFLQEEMYYLLPNIWCIWASLRPHGFEMSKV